MAISASNIDYSVGKLSPMPHQISPMLASLTKGAFDKKDWIFEIKWDGYRAIAEINDGEVNLYSRNKQNFNLKFFPLIDELAKFGFQVIVDGEIVVLDIEGKPKFQLLQNFEETSSGSLIYYIFDLLYFSGRDLTTLPLGKRKELLKSIFPASNRIRYSDHLVEKGNDLFNLARLKGLEGIIAKNANSLYHPGQRSTEWLKIKTQKRQEAVIGGFTTPRGGRKYFGALVLGVYEKGELVYIGQVGGGFSEKVLKSLREKLEPIIVAKSPFKLTPKTNTPVSWVKPELVAEVGFSEWTKEGNMRHPIFLGLRDDKNPNQVLKEVAHHNPTQKEPALASSIKSKERPKIAGEDLNLTNLEKIYWPEEGYTKKDLINYYKKIASYILPYLEDRPESLNRFPNGIAGEGFWQKDVKDLTAYWIQTVSLHSDSEDKDINYLLCQNKATLIYLANLGCIEINPWNSRIKNLDNPDYLVLDLDPEKIVFSEVVRVAKTIHKILESAKVPNFCKTSGATGLHIYVPLEARYSYDQARQFSEIVAHLTHRQLPATTSLARNPSKRQGKVYIDYLQNRRGQTLAAAYSLRPHPFAPVSTPLTWDEVSENLEPKNFNMKTIFARLEKYGDIWSGVMGRGIDIEASLNLLSQW